jgi:hypothetical protein
MARMKLNHIERLRAITDTVRRYGYCALTQADLGSLQYLLLQVDDEPTRAHTEGMSKATGVHGPALDIPPPAGGTER